MRRFLLHLGLCLAVALPTCLGGLGCVPYTEVREDDDPKPKRTTKKKRPSSATKKKRPMLPPREAFRARFLDRDSMKLCAMKPLLLDRTFEVRVLGAPPEDRARGYADVEISFELCGPAGASGAARLRMVWQRRGEPTIETACDAPDIPGGESGRNPGRVTCRASEVPFPAAGKYGVDVYLGDELLTEAKFRVEIDGVADTRKVRIDEGPRLGEAWLGLLLDGTGRARRVGLEVRIPPPARVTVIYSWYRDGEQIWKPREVERDEYDGNAAFLVGPKVPEILSNPGKYTVKLSIDGTPALTASFIVTKTGIVPHPHQELEAFPRINDRFLLVATTALGHPLLPAVSPKDFNDFGVWGKLAE